MADDLAAQIDAACEARGWVRTVDVHGWVLWSDTDGRHRAYYFVADERSGVTSLRIDRMRPVFHPQIPMLMLAGESLYFGAGDLRLAPKVILAAIAASGGDDA